MNEVHIVIADDDPAMVRLLERHLGSAGYTLSTCSNGNDAFELVSQNVPVILLADWEMPGLSGVELCHRIRASKLEDGVYIILLALLPKAHHRSGVYDSGGNGSAPQLW